MAWPKSHTLSPLHFPEETFRMRQTVAGTNATLSHHDIVIGLLHRHIQHVYNWVLKKKESKRPRRQCQPRELYIQLHEIITIYNTHILII